MQTIMLKTHRVENAVFSLHQATGGGAISVTNRSSASVSAFRVGGRV